VINGEKRSTEKKTADKNREKTIEKQSNDRKVDGDGNRRNRVLRFFQKRLPT
jgi:hypothetical protein